MILKKTLSYSFLPTSSSFYTSTPTKPPVHPSFKKTILKATPKVIPSQEDEERFLNTLLSEFYAKLNEEDIQEKISLIKMYGEAIVEPIKIELKNDILALLEEVVDTILLRNPFLLKPLIHIVSEVSSVPECIQDQYIGYLNSLYPTLENNEQSMGEFRGKLDIIIEALTMFTLRTCI